MVLFLVGFIPEKKCCVAFNEVFGIKTLISLLVHELNFLEGKAILKIRKILSISLETLEQEIDLNNL